VTKKTTKPETRTVLGSKISTNKTSSATLSSSKKTQQISITKAPAGNSLDSTAPAIKRGKEREKPKKKRPSKMRKIISAEKAAKLISREINMESNTVLDVNDEEKSDNDTSDNVKLIEKVNGEINSTDAKKVENVSNTSINNSSQPKTPSAKKSLSNEEESSFNNDRNDNQCIKAENVSSESDILYQAKQIVHSRKFKMLKKLLAFC